MARQSAADRRAAEAAEREKQAKELAEFQEKVLPVRILELLAKAEQRGDVRASVHNPPGGGLRVQFCFSPEDEHSSYAFEPILRLTSEPYEVDAVVQQFIQLEARDAERLRKRQVAQEAYDLLSPEQREALGVRKPY